jgi:hypothetical protein
LGTNNGRGGAHHRFGEGCPRRRKRRIGGFQVRKSPAIACRWPDRWVRASLLLRAAAGRHLPIAAMHHGLVLLDFAVDR